MPPDDVTREQLLRHMRQPGFQACRMKDLAREIGVAPRSYRSFRQLVRELEAEGLLVRLRSNRFALAGEHHLVAGQLRVHPRGFGFVVSAGQQSDLYIPRGALGAAIDGDEVQAEITGQDADGRGPEGRIVSVVRPAARTLVGTLVRRGDRAAVEVDDPAIQRDVYLRDRLPDSMDPGARVVVQVTDRGWGFDGLKGRIVQHLGSGDDPALDFAAVVHRFDLPVDYPAAAQAVARSVGMDPVASSLSQRLDLRAQCCVTVDPPGARDFDDAVSLQRSPKGGYHLGVHIADVSHFVQPGTELDLEACRRGCSVYLLDHVVHMLPDDLAAGACSLQCGKDRLSVSVLIDLDPDGRIKAFTITESVIRSAARLDYQQVQTALDGAGGAAAPWTVLLRLMDELSARLRLSREQRGALDLDLPEPRVDLDAAGMPLALGRQPRLASHRIIEEFMLLANECVGQFAARHQLPVLYRVHPPPDAAKLRRLAAAAPSLTLGHESRIEPERLQEWLSSITEREDAHLWKKRLLQAMTRAVYAERNAGHYGLALPRYLHFTAPIRRYPDLFVHRVVKAALRRDRDASSREERPGNLSWLARWCSQCEQRAETAERTYRALKQLRYMEQRLGEECSGMVSAVLRNGFFVELTGSMMEGFCSLRAMDGYFEYDPRRQRLTNLDTGQSIRTGIAVRVRISRVDRNAQRMDLQLIEASYDRTSHRTSFRRKRSSRPRKTRGQPRRMPRRRRR